MPCMSWKTESETRSLTTVAASRQGKHKESAGVSSFAKQMMKIMCQAIVVAVSTPLRVLLMRHDVRHSFPPSFPRYFVSRPHFLCSSFPLSLSPSCDGKCIKQATASCSVIVLSSQMNKSFTSAAVMSASLATTVKRSNDEQKRTRLLNST